MNAFATTIRACIFLSFAFFIQFAVSAAFPGFLLFPAAAVYSATFLTAPSAAFLGLLAGGAWDAISPAPFGMYALLFSSSMGIASLGMRALDDRSIAARGALALFILLLGTGVLCISYFIVFGYQTDMFKLLMKDGGVAALLIICIAGCHALQRRL